MARPCTNNPTRCHGYIGDREAVRITGGLCRPCFQAVWFPKKQGHRPGPCMRCGFWSMKPDAGLCGGCQKLDKQRTEETVPKTPPKLVKPNFCLSCKTLIGDREECHVCGFNSKDATFTPPEPQGMAYHTCMADDCCTAAEKRLNRAATDIEEAKRKKEKKVAGVVNVCAGCNERIYDMEPCEKCGLSGTEVARGVTPASKRQETKKQTAKTAKKTVAVNEKLYVVVKLGWEYDDSYYHRPECGGGQPIKAYRSREKADDACDLLNGRWIRTEGKDMRREGYDDGPLQGYEVVEVEQGDS